MNNPTRLSGFCGTPIGLKRDGARPPWSRRDSEASDYSCAYEVDVDGLDEGDLVKLKLPDLPPHVRDAFRAVARGDAAALEAALDGDERLVYCANQGGSSLLEVARERGHDACVDVLRRRERANALLRTPAVPEEASVASTESPPSASTESPPSAAPAWYDTPARAIWTPPLKRTPKAMPLDDWLEAQELGPLSESLSDMAGDVDDLKEMTDDDVDELLAAATALFASATLRDSCESRLRDSLRAIGANVSASSGGDRGDDGGDGDGGSVDGASLDASLDAVDEFDERGDFDDDDADGEVPAVRPCLVVAPAEAEGVTNQVCAPPDPPAVSPPTPDPKASPGLPPFSELGKDGAFTTPRPSRGAGDPFSEARDARDPWPACPFSELSHTVSPVRDEEA